MKKVDVRRVIDQRLNEFLRPKGFKKNSKLRCFDRATEVGFHSVVPDVLDYQPNFEISLFLELRVDAVEDILNSAEGFESDQSERTTTARFELDFLGAPELNNLTITSESELRSVLDKWTKVLEQVGLPMMEQSNSTDSLEALMNSPNNRDYNFGYSQPNIGFIRVCLAHLAKNPEINTVIHTQRIEMADYPKAAYEQFDKFVNMLLKMH